MAEDSSTDGSVDAIVAATDDNTSSADDAVISTETWRSSLPEDIRDNPMLGSVPDVATLAKNFIETKRMVGADTLRVPGNDATDEERGAFFAKLGRPETPADYKVPTENMPEGFAVDDGRLGSMRDEAHRLGITDQQFAGLIRADANFQHGAVAQMAEANAASALESQTKLKGEWGKAYEQNIALAQRAITQFGSDDLKSMMDETGLGNDPRVIKAFHNIGRALADDEVLGGGGGQIYDKTPEQALAARNELLADKDFYTKYRTSHLPGHAEAVAKMNDLAAQAWPEKEPVVL